MNLGLETFLKRARYWRDWGNWILIAFLIVEFILEYGLRYHTIGRRGVRRTQVCCGLIGIETLKDGLRSVPH